MIKNMSNRTSIVFLANRQWAWLRCNERLERLRLDNARVVGVAHRRLLCVSFVLLVMSARRSSLLYAHTFRSIVIMITTYVGKPVLDSGRKYGRDESPRVYESRG